jgi:hypothetical protein
LVSPRGHPGRGNVLIEQGDFPAAEAALARAIQLTRHGPGITAARAHTFMARLRQIAGDQAGATAAIATVESIVSGWEPSGERSFFAAYIARLRLLGGDSAAARRWASERRPWQPDEPHSYFREIELLTIASWTATAAPRRWRAPVSWGLSPEWSHTPAAYRTCLRAVAQLDQPGLVRYARFRERLVKSIEKEACDDTLE